GQLSGDHEVSLRGDDGHGGITNQSFTINVVDVTDPVFTSGTTEYFVEDGTGAAHTAEAIDSNPLTYSLGTGNDESLFDITTAGIVTFKTPPDFENPIDGTADGSSNTYLINVIADDGTNEVNQDVTLTVIKADNTAPVITSAQVVDFTENGTGAAYTVTATDTNPVSFSLGAGNDEGLFNINAGVITFRTPPDFESPVDGNGDNEYEINVIVTDVVNNTTNQNVTISVTNEDEILPVFTSTATVVSFAENGTGTVYTITATDANPVSYGLGTGNDEGLFNINAGVITFKAVPDFEAPADANTDNLYVIEVQASDGTNAIRQTVTVVVTDENDNAPEFTSVPVTSVSDNEVYSYQVTASDADRDFITVETSVNPGWLTLRANPVVVTYHNFTMLPTR
ncbi:MAG: cadherin repeat domain-containing protein, partial [Roseivirga sp.]|nr:cadherin repeat domain-containing protein [Roseivirga sp.]